MDSGDFCCVDLSKCRQEIPEAPVCVSGDLKSFLASYQSGQVDLLGIPFDIARGPAGVGICLPPGPQSRLQIPIERPARWLLIIHDVDGGGQSNPVARYRLYFDTADPVERAIRRGIEIPDRGMLSPNLGTFETSRLQPAAKDAPYAFRQMGLSFAPPPSPYRIFVWRNPHHEIPIARLECENTGDAAIILSAITLASEETHPVRIVPRTSFAIDFSGLDDVALDDVQVEIDRGMVVRLEPLAPLGSEFFDSPRKGWGIDPSAKPDSLRAEIFGPAGARISIRLPSGEQGGISLADALAAGPQPVGDDGIRIEVLHPEKTWVHCKVIDADTGKPVAARIHLRGERGEYIPPAGHHRDVNSEFLELNGADVCLHGTNYAYVDGTFQAALPVGRIHVEAVRGLEYTPARSIIEIRPGQNELAIPIRRYIDMNAEGYFSGDTHVHFVTTQGGLLEAQGEDLDIMNLLISQWGKLYTSFEQFTGAPSRISTDETIVYVNQENRQHTLGHMNLLGLKEPVFPICTGEAGEAWLGDAIEACQADWCRETHRQGGLVVQPHFGNCFGEYIPGVLLGHIDATEIAPMTFLGEQFTQRAYENWYRILNCGVRMPLVGGTDKMSNGTCVGGCRGYVFLGKDQPLDYDAWCDGIRAGNTFTTTGPMLFFTVDGKPMGSQIRMSARGGTVEVAARAVGYFPLSSMELIHCGRVIASEQAAAGACSVDLHAHVPIRESGWLAVRCWGRPDIPGPRGLTAAHSSPIYFEVGDRPVFHATDAHYLIEVVDQMTAWAEEVGVFATEQKRLDVVRLFALSKEILHQRLHAAGDITHRHGDAAGPHTHHH